MNETPQPAYISLALSQSNNTVSITQTGPPGGEGFDLDQVVSLFESLLKGAGYQIRGLTIEA